MKLGELYMWKVFGEKIKKVQHLNNSKFKEFFGELNMMAYLDSAITLLIFDTLLIFVVCRIAGLVVMVADNQKRK